MIVQYSDTANKVLVDHRDKMWVERKLMMLQSDIKELKRVVERLFASHCPFGLYILKFHLLYHLVEESERFGSIFFYRREADLAFHRAH